jgi:HSP20 family protein
VAERRGHPLERMERDFDTLLRRLWGGLLAPGDQDSGSMRLWDFDVTEKDQEIVVRAEIPGFEDSELDVKLIDNVLTIQAEKEQKGDGQEEYRSFYRAVTLPSGIDPNNVKATYRNGVLEVHIPRAEGAGPKRIEVQGQQGQQAQGRATKNGGVASQSGAQGQPAKNQAEATASGKGTK